MTTLVNLSEAGISIIFTRENDDPVFVVRPSGDNGKQWVIDNCPEAKPDAELRVSEERAAHLISMLLRLR